MVRSLGLLRKLEVRAGVEADVTGRAAGIRRGGEPKGQRKGVVRAVHYRVGVVDGWTGRRALGRIKLRLRHVRLGRDGKLHLCYAD